ncbi:hypothetical protein ABBQ32_000861 [Trebouxia sp. C0010 RCD-2024]
MPEGETAGQAVPDAAPQQALVTTAQEQHFQTLENIIGFFEKQDPEGFFGVPVTESVAPNYFNVIKKPMSFLRMRQKLRALEYRTFTAFVDDFELVGNNAMRYNQKRSRVHRSAVNLLRHGKKHLNTVQLEATRAIHMLHPDGPIAAAQEEAAANRAANPINLAPSTSNLSKLLPSSSNLSRLLPSTSNLSKLVSTLSLPLQSSSSKQLHGGMSGLDMSVPMVLQDLQAEYFSEEDPAYSSFSDTDLDDSGDEHRALPFSLGTQRQAVIAERWGITASHDTSSSAPNTATAVPSTDSASGTLWQAHWLELRILALKQQQQRYELRLQKLQEQQDRQGTVLLPSCTPADSPAGRALQTGHQQAQPSLPVAHQQAAEPISVPHHSKDSFQQLAAPAAPAKQATVSAAGQQPRAQTQPLADQQPAAGAAACLVMEQSHRQQQQAAAVREPRHKHRHSRIPVPGLSMPEIARHPFFCQHSGAGDRSVETPAAQEEARDDCYPARVHATLDLLDRHLATMKTQLTPKPLPGRAPPKKVARGGVAVARRGKAKPGRARGLFAPPSKQVLDRTDSKLGKRRRAADYDFGDVIMPPLPGAKALAHLPKVCIKVPGVRPLPQTELARRQRAVELLRSGINMSEADADITDLLRASCGIAAASADSMVSSSDEDTSDEAFAGRHAALEAEEQHRFNSFAGGGAQRSARNASGSKPRLPKPPVRMDSMPPPEAKLLNVAPAAASPHAASVAMDPSAMLGAHSSHAVTAAAPVAVVPASQAVSSTVSDPHKSHGSTRDRADAGQENAQIHVSNGQGGPRVADDQSRQADSSSPASLPQLGLTVAPHKLHADVDRPLSRLLSKTASKSGRKNSTPRSNVARASTGRPPRSGSGPGSVSHQDSVASDMKDGSKTRRNTTG